MNRAEPNEQLITITMYNLCVFLFPRLLSLYWQLLICSLAIANKVLSVVSENQTVYNETTELKGQKDRERAL